MNDQEQGGQLVEEAKKLGGVLTGNDRGIVQFGRHVLPFAKIIVDIMDEPSTVLERVKVWEAAYLEAYPEPQQVERKVEPVSQPAPSNDSSMQSPHCDEHNLAMRLIEKKGNGDPLPHGPFYVCAVADRNSQCNQKWNLKQWLESLGAVGCDLQNEPD